MSRRFCPWIVVLGLVAATDAAAAGDLSTSYLEDEVVRFLVGEFPGHEFHNDSYVLPLSRAADIAHARELILSGPSAGATIAIAKIAKGADGINRNVRAPGSPPWSWHVTGFEGFADNTIEILDGWPTYVESDVDGWIANTGGYIGFWTYTVVAELPQGDYDADLDVDGDDLVVWEAGFGGMVDLSADGNGNGMVDAADYVLWRQNLGKSITQPSQRTAAAVPEPHGLTLAFAASTVIFVWGHRRRWGDGGHSQAESDERIEARFFRACAGGYWAGAGGGRIGDGVRRAY